MDKVENTLDGMRRKNSSKKAIIMRFCGISDSNALLHDFKFLLSPFVQFSVRLSTKLW